MDQVKKDSAGSQFYMGLRYKPCGCCDVCCDPELSYSDCGQPVLIDDGSNQECQP